jgi:hypothetical protein
MFNPSMATHQKLALGFLSSNPKSVLSLLSYLGGNTKKFKQKALAKDKPST